MCEALQHSPIHLHVVLLRHSDTDTFYLLKCCGSKMTQICFEVDIYLNSSLLPQNTVLLACVLQGFLVHCLLKEIEVCVMDALLQAGG
jgi:hypothetical protein